MNKYEAVIGLEVHAQLLTNSKAFCSCSTVFGASPNTNTCPICLGHPGTLPTLNKSLVEFIVKMGLATNCKIREKSTFARKNYFYADLVKGYQITQDKDPICYDGFIEIESANSTVSSHTALSNRHTALDAVPHDISDNARGSRGKPAMTTF